MAPVPPAPLSPGYRSTPFWWDGAPGGFPEAGEVPGKLPGEVDVVVVGGGYTGLGVAREVAARGREVVVLEAGPVAGGASSRNGGMVHPGGKHDLPELLAMAGGREIWEETVAAFEGLEALIGAERIDCGWRRTGHLELARHPRAAARLREVAAAYRTIGEEARFLTAGELGPEIGSEAFCGGLLVARSGSVDPARLAVGLAGAAVTAGADLRPGTPVTSVSRAGAGFEVVTTRGRVRAREVAVATNGSTDGLVGWLGRRILPIGSYIVATETLDPELARSVIPGGRMVFDSRNFLHYWRLSPEGDRVLFGGRTSFAPTTVERSRDQLYRAMVEVHPQLAGVALERAWGGQVALTADRLPHLGRDPSSRVVYAMGYCGTGVALSTHLGRAVGRWLCGEGELPEFADRPWPRVPALARVPGLLPVAGWWYRGMDRLGR